MPSEPVITFIRPKQLTTKAPYAYAAVAGPGQLIFTAGACPLDADGKTVAVGDVAGQARRVMNNLVIALQAAGAQLTDVVKATVYVASFQQADLVAAWRSYEPPSASMTTEHAARRQRSGLRQPAGRGRGDRGPSLVVRTSAGRLPSARRGADNRKQCGVIAALNVGETVTHQPTRKQVLTIIEEGSGSCSMRISTHNQLLATLDDIVASSSRGDRTSEAADEFWAELLTREGHPLATNLPDENLVAWSREGLLGVLHGARVLDVGCGNGRNSRWLDMQGAQVHGIDVSTTLLELVRSQLPATVRLTAADVLRGSLPSGPFDLIYDSGCFHHLPPHRRATYLERVLGLLAPSGVYGIVTLASEVGESSSDTAMLASGDNGGGTSFGLADLTGIFSSLEPLEARRVETGVDGTFGMDFLNAAVFRARAGDGMRGGSQMPGKP